MVCPMRERPSSVSLAVATFALASLAVSILSFVCSVLALNQAGKRPAMAPTIIGNVDYEAALAALRADMLRQQADFESHRRAWQRLVDSGTLSGRHAFAILDPTTKNFARADTSSGFFLVSCREVQPYADGSKVVLDISNPMSISFVGFRLDVRWGERYAGREDDLVGIGKWAASLQAKNEPFTQTLEPGRWNQVEVILKQTPPAQLGHIQVAIVSDVVGVARLAVPALEPPKIRSFGRYQIATSELFNTLMLDTETGQIWKLRAGPNHEDVWVRYLNPPR
jgi:Protein of unknown function (DUF3251)